MRWSSVADPAEKWEIDVNRNQRQRRILIQRQFVLWREQRGLEIMGVAWIFFGGGGHFFENFKKFLKKIAKNALF